MDEDLTLRVLPAAGSLSGLNGLARVKIFNFWLELYLRST
jgi:hypothetical protein